MPERSRQEVADALAAMAGRAPAEPTRAADPDAAAPASQAQTPAAPAPPASWSVSPAASSKPAHRGSPSTSRGASAESLALPRTLIPILLTCGGMFPLAALLMLLSDGDSPLGSLPVFLPVLLLVIGLMLLGLAVLNMLQVKHQLGIGLGPEPGNRLPEDPGAACAAHPRAR